MKLAIWIMMLVGLAPAVLLAVTLLASNISLARHIEEGGGFEHDDGSSAYFTSSYIRFGESLRLEVATTIWPSICLILGASACVVGLLFLIPRQSQFIETGAFEKIQKHVETVMKSRSLYAYLVISPSGDEYSTHLHFDHAFAGLAEIRFESMADSVRTRPGVHRNCRESSAGPTEVAVAPGWAVSPDEADLRLRFARTSSHDLRALTCLSNPLPSRPEYHGSHETQLIDRRGAGTFRRSCQLQHEPRAGNYGRQ